MVLLRENPHENFPLHLIGLNCIMAVTHEPTLSLIPETGKYPAWIAEAWLSDPGTSKRGFNMIVLRPVRVHPRGEVKVHSTPTPCKSPKQMNGNWAWDGMEGN